VADPVATAVNGGRKSDTLGDRKSDTQRRG
jgi:hypothetical protein